MPGNAAEQLEAALVDSMIEGLCEQHNATEVRRDYVLADNGALEISVVIRKELPVEHITVTATIL